MTRAWAKRESQLISVVDSTMGMHGDLQGIAGKAMPEIESLEIPLLDGPEQSAALTAVSAASQRKVHQPYPLERLADFEELLDRCWGRNTH